MSKPISYRISPETYRLLAENRDFYKSLRDLQDRNETPLKPKATGADARAESKQLDNGDVEVTLVLPLDSNDDPLDGRLYIRDTFVFDPSESVLKSYQRSFENNQKGGAEWQGWLEKYQALAKQESRPISYPAVQVFAQRVARSFSRPITDENANTLPEIRTAFTEESRILTTTNRQILDLNAGLQLKIKDNLNYYSLVRKDEKLEVILQLAADDDREASNGRILLRDKFTLDGKTLAFEQFEREWKLAPDSPEDPRFTAALAALQAQPNPPREEAEAFIANLLPELTPKGEPDLAPALSLMGGPVKISGRSRFAKTADSASFPTVKFSLDAMEILAQEQLAQRSDESKGWASFGPKVDEAGELAAVHSLFQKAGALAAQSPGKSPFALLQSLSANDAEKRLVDRLLGDKLMGELNDLATEPDAGLRGVALANFARQKLLTDGGFGQSAAFIAETLKQDAATRPAAADIISILEGKGSLGQKVGYILPRFTQEVAKPSMLVGMAAAPFLGAAFELGGLKLGLQLAKGGELGWKARGLATLAGMGGEALAFTTIHQTVDSMGHDPHKVWEHTENEVLSSFLLFSTMRVAHMGSGFATARMAEGRLGSFFGKRVGAEAYSGFGATPLGRLLEGRFAAAAGAGIPTLTKAGEFASGVLNHGAGILGMQLSGSLSRQWGLAPENGQGFGANFFDATVGYAQAMVGFNLAHAATGGRLQPAVMEFKQRVAARHAPSSSSESAPDSSDAITLQRPAVPAAPSAPEPARAAEPEAAVPAQADLARTLVDPPREADPPVRVEPAAPAVREADFATLEGAFRAAGWSPERQAEALAFLKGRFSNGGDGYHVGWLGSGIYSEAQIRDQLPKLLFELTALEFSADAQWDYLKSQGDLGFNHGDFLFHSPGILAALRVNGLNAAQIEPLMEQLRNEAARSYQHYANAVANHHCIIGFPGMGNEYPGILRGLEQLKETGWSVAQKVAFLKKGSLHASSMDRFIGSLPQVKAWMATEGWTADHAAQFLGSYSLRHGAFDAETTRRQLAQYGFGPDLQAELLSNLVQNKNYSNRNVELNLLEPFLQSLHRRGWSVPESFRVLNSLAKESGDSTFSQLPSLLWLVHDLENSHWPAPEIKELVFAFTDHPGSEPKALFEALRSFIPSLETQGWERPALRSFLKDLAEKSNGDLNLALSVFNGISREASAESQPELAKRFLSILGNCNPYNRNQVLSLLQGRLGLFHALGSAYFPAHLELYAAVMERWPRIGYSVLTNIMEATQAGIIPQDIAGARAKILDFVEQTNAFNAVHYRIYLREGDPFLQRLNQYAARLLAEDFSVEEARNLVAQYDRLLEPEPRPNRLVNRAYWGGNGPPEYSEATEGEKFLLGLLQRVSPASGVSFARDGEMVRLLRKVLEAGDLRSHVPQAWRSRVFNFTMARGGMELKPGERLDPEGKIKGLLEQFRLQPGEQGPSHDELTEAMIAYLASGRNPAERRRLQVILFKRAAASEELRGKLQNITELDFTSLTILEEIFKDADNLPKFLKDAFEHVPRGRGLVTQLGSAISLMGDAEGVVKQIKKVARNANLPAERRKEILTNLVKAYKPDGIEAKILSRDDIPQEIKDEIRSVLGERPDLTPREIIEEVLREPRELIEAEKNKYQYQNQGSQKIGLRAVKGPAFGLHGFLSGVCIAPDVQLWKDPRFKLLAITDETESQALGYIHVYETVIGGKKYLTLPGINPSAEYLGAFSRKQANLLFKKLMEGVKDFAEAGDYEGVYIPTSSNIHSNRGYIQEAIAKAAYPKKPVPEVRWNNLPSPYPFKQVYVVWEKGNRQQP